LDKRDDHAETESGRRLISGNWPRKKATKSSDNTKPHEETTPRDKQVPQSRTSTTANNVSIPHKGRPTKEERTPSQLLLLKSKVEEHLKFILINLSFQKKN